MDGLLVNGHLEQVNKSSREGRRGEGEGEREGGERGKKQRREERER